MDEIERLRQYAARTSPAASPDVDVADDVMATLRRRGNRPAPSPTRTIFTAVAASWLVAIGIGLFAQQSLSDVQDPMNSLTAPFSVTLE
ncbi:MAG TPA: hypothetical protein VGM76_11245 [Lacipirellulaceae bacterium]|jgi:hypothetical protein